MVATSRRSFCDFALIVTSCSTQRWTPARRRSISGPDLPHTGSVAGGGTAAILASACSRSPLPGIRMSGPRPPGYAPTINSSGLAASPLWATPAGIVLTQARDRGGVEAEPVGKHFFGVLAEQWRRFDFARNAVEAHRPGRHRHFAFAVRHRLEDAALPEAGPISITSPAPRAMPR
jgi:hypothetical protein